MGKGRMMRKKLGLLVLVTLVVAACALVFGSIGAEGKPKTPKRVLIVLFDQMRPEYADRFDMTNFKKLRGEGTSFDKAYLGYMGSETVIAHNVITSGQLPKHMGWVDEGYRDANDVLGFGSDTMHITGDLSYSDFRKLITAENGGAGYPKLADYLRAKFGKKFITVGEKSYAVETAAATVATQASYADGGDIAVRMSSRKSDSATCKATLGGAYRYPAKGVNVPEYLSGPKNADGTFTACNRFFVNADKGDKPGFEANHYGTRDAFPSFMYPEEANRFVPGTDSAHLGGDVWVADAAMAMMENERDLSGDATWAGMFVTLGGIDKNGHMWGADQDTDGHDCSVGTGQVHVDCAAKIADAQLGRMIKKLEDLGQLDDTLIVLTADHGATHAGPLKYEDASKPTVPTGAANFYGKPTLLAGDTNWYYDPLNASFDGGLPSGSTYNGPSTEIAKLGAALGGNLQFSYQSTSIQAWLTNHETSDKLAAVGPMSDAAGVIATYWRDGDHYVLADTNPMTKSEEKWWKKNGQDIVDGMAADNGPDVVGLLQDDTGYGVYGDHGGASEEVQRVPVVFWTADGKKGSKTGEPFQTPDVMPTILREMGIPLTAPVDGKARKVK